MGCPGLKSIYREKVLLLMGQKSNQKIFLDTLLKPYLKYFKSYIRDSVEFLNKRPREVDSGTEIVTLDVTSLCTSMLHESSLKALGYFLTSFGEEMNPRFNNHFILDQQILF